jgi:hypothetical protein
LKDKTVLGIKFRVVGVLAVLTALAGCEWGPAGITVDLSSSYDFSNFRANHEGRDTRVVIHGTLFGMKREPFATAVTGAMQGKNNGRPTNFTTRPGKSVAENYRVILIFNGSLGASPDPCTGGRFRPNDDVGGTGKRLHIEAAWCNDSNAESHLVATAKGIKGPNDPAFARLIADLTLNLFPLTDEDQGKTGRSNSYQQ